MTDPDNAAEPAGDAPYSLGDRVRLIGREEWGVGVVAAFDRSDVGIDFGDSFKGLVWRRPHEIYCVGRKAEPAAGDEVDVERKCPKCGQPPGWGLTGCDWPIHHDHDGCPACSDGDDSEEPPVATDAIPKAGFRMRGRIVRGVDDRDPTPEGFPPADPGPAYLARQNRELSELRDLVDDARGSVVAQAISLDHARFMAAGWRRLAKEERSIASDHSDSYDHLRFQAETRSSELRAEIAALRVETRRPETIPLEIAGLALRAIREVPDPRARAAMLADLESLHPETVADLSGPTLDRLKGRPGAQPEASALDAWLRAHRSWEVLIDAIEPRVFIELRAPNNEWHRTVTGDGDTIAEAFEAARAKLEGGS